MKHRGAIKASTRADDERHLQWLRWRCSGFTSGAISAASGYRQEHIRTATNRIKDADILESGEPIEIVKECYW